MAGLAECHGPEGAHPAETLSFGGVAWQEKGNGAAGRGKGASGGGANHMARSPRSRTVG